jgi:hypothetical protein
MAETSEPLVPADYCPALLAFELAYRLGKDQSGAVVEPRAK